MREGFRGHLGSIVDHARAVAVSRGSATIEVEHLLLAIVEHPSARLDGALRTLWLTGEVVTDALDREVEEALRAVGVEPASAMRPAAPRVSKPGWGESAKLAWRRTAGAASERGVKRLDDRHLLLGIARAEAGVIPRVLDRLGLSRAAIEQAVG